MASLPIAVLISGGGTTLKNLLNWQAAGDLPVDFRLVISSNPKANGIAFADEGEIPVEVLSKKKFVSAEAHSQALFEAVRSSGAQYVVMGGYLEHLLIPADFENRVINIHPSLIPAFCGKGFYGLRVHQAAIDYGVKLTGCTVHFVDNHYDHGPIIAQRTCQVYREDTAESLQKRVFELECHLLPVSLAAIANGHVHVEGRRVSVSGIL